MESWNIVEEGSSNFSSAPQWRRNLKSGSPSKRELGRIEEESKYEGRWKRKEPREESLEDDIRLGLDIVEQYKKNATKFKKESEKFKRITNEGKEEQKALPKELARHEQPYFKMEIRHKERLQKRAQMKQKKIELAVQNVPPNRTESRIQSLREKRQVVEKEAQVLAEMSKKVKDQVEKEVAELKAFDRAQKQLEVERKRKEEYEREMERLLAERAKSLKNKKKHLLTKLTQIVDLKFKRARLRVLRRSWHSVSSHAASIKMKLVKAGCSRRFSLLCRCFSGLANYCREERIKREEEQYLKQKQIQELKKKQAAQLYNTRLLKLGLRSVKLFIQIAIREREEEEREEKRKRRLQEFFESVQSRIDQSRVLEQQRKKHSEQTQFEEVKQPVIFDESTLSPIKECEETIQQRSPQSLKTITEEMCETEREIKVVASPGQRYSNMIQEEEEQPQQQKVESRVKVSKIVLEMQKRDAQRKKKRMELEQRKKERQAQKQRDQEEQKKKQEQDAKRLKQQKLKEAREKKQAELRKKEEKKEARLKEQEKQAQAGQYYLTHLKRRAFNTGFKGLIFSLRVKQARAGQVLRKAIIRRGWSRIEKYVDIQRQLNYQREAHQTAVAITQYTFALKKRAYFAMREYLMIQADELIIAQEKKEVVLILRCFEAWQKALPKLREERVIRTQHEYRISTSFQRVYVGKRVLRGWLSFMEQSIRERNKQKAKAQLWAKVNIWRNK